MVNDAKPLPNDASVIRACITVDAKTLDLALTVLALMTTLESVANTSTMLAKLAPVRTEPLALTTASDLLVSVQTATLAKLVKKILSTVKKTHALLRLLVSI